MLYELAYFIKGKCIFLWNAIEWGNASLFALIYKETLKSVSERLDKIGNEAFTISAAQESDVSRLVVFFAEQPERVLEFFNSYRINEKSILKILTNKVYQTFVVVKDGRVVGYFFIRLFANGKCSHIGMADHKTIGRGVGKLMAKAFEEIVTFAGFSAVASISLENFISLNSAKAASDVRIIKILDNRYYYIECTPKDTNRGGGKFIVASREHVCNLKLAA